MFYNTHHKDLDTPKYTHVLLPSMKPTGFIEHFIYTQCSIMDAPQYVLADEPSDFPVFGTFCSTLHRDTDAPQYVQADVPSGYLCY